MEFKNLNKPNFLLILKSRGIQTGSKNSDLLLSRRAIESLDHSHIVFKKNSMILLNLYVTGYRSKWIFFVKRKPIM